MYGTRFIQHFGWYVNQQYLRLGIQPRYLAYLRDVCPNEYQAKIERVKAASLEFKTGESRLLAVGSQPVDTPREATSYWATFTNSDTQAFTTLRRKTEQTRRALTKEIEN